MTNYSFCIWTRELGDISKIKAVGHSSDTPEKEREGKSKGMVGTSN